MPQVFSLFQYDLKDDLESRQAVAEVQAMRYRAMMTEAASSNPHGNYFSPDGYNDHE